MKHFYLCMGMVAFSLGAMCKAHAATLSDTPPKDTLAVHELDEVKVLGKSQIMRQAGELNKLAGSYELITPTRIRQLDLHSIADLTGVVPNFYMPDYGSKLTSAIYVRGIGSRSSGQTIGMYIDGVPVLNKAAFNGEMQGVQSIEIINGPQGMLYGRNAMGGIINIRTYSPIERPGTDIRLTAGNYGTYRALATHRHKFSERLGLSLGGYYGSKDGFFKNEFNGKRADSEQAAGGLLKLEWNTGKGGLLQVASQYDYIHQGAFPYRRLDAKKGLQPILYNDPGLYKRHILSNRIRFTQEWSEVVLESGTGYSLLKDEMYMDQDYTPANAFTINQNQRMNSFSQEFLLKSSNRQYYDWSFGAFAFRENNDMTVPVEFKPDGIAMILQRQFNILNASGKLPVMLQADLTNSAFNNNRFTKGNAGFAFYHESTWKDLLPHLAFSAGLRLDYEMQSLDYYSDAAFRVGITPKHPGAKTLWYDKPTVLKGNGYKSTLQILPKFALKYNFGNSLFFASVSRGYKGGGYNEQMMSDAVQSAYQKDLMAMGRPQSQPSTDYLGQTSYSPEYATSFEVGMRSYPIINRMMLSAGGFYNKITDIQLTQFVASGAGRVITNAGKANSYGAELSLRTRIYRSLAVTVNYGYTHATFENYFKESKVKEQLVKTDFKGKFIPYIPQHTFTAQLSFNEGLAKSHFFDRLFGTIDLRGAGPIFWDEANTIRQNVYATLGARIGIAHGAFSLSAWGQNLTNSRHNIFYFQSMGNNFLQQSNPLQFGLDLTLNL